MEAEADFETWCNSYYLYVYIPRIFHPYTYFRTETVTPSECRVLAFMKREKYHKEVID